MPTKLFRGAFWEDLHCVDGMLEGVSREAGPFEFVVCAGGARVPRTVRVGPFTGSGNPFLRSWALLVAVWAACLDYHLWG